MTWTRLPDDFTDRPDVLGLGRSARLLHVEALVWCNRLLTDGVIPANALRRLSDTDDLERDVQELVGAGLWTPGEDGGWQVDWSEQEPAATVKKRKQKRAQIQKRYNERKERHADGDHSICDPRFCQEARKGSPDVSSIVSDDGLPSRPVPSRPDPVGEGQGQGGSAAASATAPAARRPQRTSGGWLATIDAATLAELPWEVAEDCPHQPQGWTWNRDGSLLCTTCDRIARLDNCETQSVESLTRPRPDWAQRIHPPEVWALALIEDPEGVTLALDLACALFQHAGPAGPAPEDVTDLAGAIYQRQINTHRLADAWAAHEQQEETP